MLSERSCASDMCDVVSTVSPRRLDHNMRTDSGGAVSIAALAMGDESPASKKRSIELDAIIAEGQVST